MTITNLPSPILPLILNHESLERVSDFKAIRAVCRCFNDHKTVQRLRVQHTGPNSIFSFVHDKQVECLALSGDLVEITVPGLLPAALKELYLEGPENIPPALIDLALRSSTIEILVLRNCDLDGMSVPDTPPASLKELDLGEARDIPPQLINLALSSSTIEELSLRYCDLAEISVPESLPASLTELDLTGSKNIPADLITKARACPHCNVIT